MFKNPTDKLRAYQRDLLGGQREQQRQRVENSPQRKGSALPKEEVWITYFSDRVKEYAKSEVEQHN